MIGRDGSKVICAEWCGGGCTQNGYDQAMKLAKSVAQVLGPNWVPFINENLGWYPYAQTKCGRLRVAIDKRTLSGGARGLYYTAYLGENPPGAHWVESASNPRQAVLMVIDQAKERLERIGAMLRALPYVEAPPRSKSKRTRRG